MIQIPPEKITIPHWWSDLIQCVHHSSIRIIQENNAGFDIEIAKEICARNNWTLKEAELIDWNIEQPRLEKGEDS